MGLADTYEQVAGTLRKTASTYTTKSSTLQTQSTSLATVVQNLVTGFDRWAGQSSYAFQSSFSKVQGDNKNITSALSQASGSMTSLAQTIDANVPAIRNYESLVQSESGLSSMPPSAANQFRQEMQLAQQASSAAELAIAAMVGSMSSQLETAANEVGVCSTGDEQGNNGINYAGKHAGPPKGLLTPVKNGFNSLAGWLRWLISTGVIGAANSTSAAIATYLLPSGNPAITILAGNLVGGASAAGIVWLINALGVTSDEAPEFFPMIQAIIGGAGIASATAVGMHFLNPPASNNQKEQQQYEKDLQQEQQDIQQEQQDIQQEQWDLQHDPQRVSQDQQKLQQDQQKIDQIQQEINNLQKQLSH